RRLGLPFRQLPSSGYAARLFAAAEPAVHPEARAVDELLACALIEARSHERFERLAEAVEDERLRAFYAELAEAESRHGDLYVELAAELAGGRVDIAARLSALADVEASIVARPDMPLRMHSG